MDCKGEYKNETPQELFIKKQTQAIYTEAVQILFINLFKSI